MDDRDLMGIMVARLQISREEAVWCLDEIIETMSRGIRDDNRLEIRGFGVWIRRGRRVVFRAGNEVREALGRPVAPVEESI